MKDLPQRYHEHPQILIWDDNDSGFAHKQVPTNTRGIVYNRWISHQNAKRLRLAAEQLRIPVFPLLRKREVMEVLDTITREEVSAPEQAEVPVFETIPLPEIEEETMPALLTNEDMMRKAKRGEMTKIILPKIAIGLPSVAAEADKLMPILKKEYHINMTRAALVQAITKYRASDASGERKVQAKIDKVVNKISPDEFAEGERLLKDARAAIDLFLNFLPALRKQSKELQEKQEKIRRLLE